MVRPSLQTYKQSFKVNSLMGKMKGIFTSGSLHAVSQALLLTCLKTIIYNKR